MNAKPWYASRTMWFNLAAILLGVADQAAGAGIGGPWLATGIAAANMALRTLTTGPLAK